MNYEVLKTLKEAQGPVSGQRLADKLSVSRSALWKQIQKLRNLGYDIEGSPNVGYRLLSAPDIIIERELSALLPPEFQGNVVVLDAADSTNDVAKEMASSGKLKAAGLILAQTQRAGRGRFGRLWISPPGGIWMSLVVRPEIAVPDAARTPLLVSTVIAEVLRETTGLDAHIKWPNDILIGEKKVAGVLTELAAELGRVDYLVIGVGLNANFHAAELEGTDLQATTLLDESGRTFDRASLAAQIACGVVERMPLLTDGFAQVLDDWRRLSVMLGRAVSVTTAGEKISGTAVDLDAQGGLIVAADTGERRVFRAGEVTMRK